MLHHEYYFYEHMGQATCNAGSGVVEGESGGTPGSHFFKRENAFPRYYDKIHIKSRLTISTADLLERSLR